MIKVSRVESIEKHPGADRLTIVKIDGATCVANMKPDGSFRYAVGDLAIRVPENVILPEKTLREIGYWDGEHPEKERGLLAGSKGNRVKNRKWMGVESEGILISLEQRGDGDDLVPSAMLMWSDFTEIMTEGKDVTAILGATPWTP